VGEAGPGKVRKSEMGAEIFALIRGNYVVEMLRHLHGALLFEFRECKLVANLSSERDGSLQRKDRDR
jgi:hypothetical protein